MALACVCPADDLSSLSISGSLATSSCRAAHFAALCPSLNALRLTLPRRLARIYHHSRRPGDVYRARGAARPLRAARLSHAHGRAWGAALIILTQGQCLSLASASEVGGSTPLGRQGSLPPLDDVNGAWPPLESSSNPRTLALAPHRPLASPWLARLGSRAVPHVQCSARVAKRPGKMSSGVHRRCAAGRAVSGAVAPARKLTLNFIKKRKGTPFHTLYYAMNGGVCSCRPCQRRPVVNFYLVSCSRYELGVV